MNYASLSNEHFQMLQHLVNTYLNGTLRTIVDKSPGHSGSFVYLIEVVLAEKRLSCIAKLTPADFALDDSLQNRVYGSCISSFNAVYRCLQQYQIPLPQLYASHTPSADIPFYCQLMEYLPGQEVNIAIKIISEEQQSTLQEFLGMHLGVIHNITRSYDGWVDLAIPHLLSWREAFFTTLHQNLDDACRKKAIAVLVNYMSPPVTVMDAEIVLHSGIKFSALLVKFMRSPRRVAGCLSQEVTLLTRLQNRA